MGWFGLGGSDSASSSVSGPTPSSDGAYIAPDRSQRDRCWEARDKFYACLDNAGIIDSVKEDAAARKNCASEMAQFEKDCAASWVGSLVKCGTGIGDSSGADGDVASQVQYFKQRRVFLHQKQETLNALEKKGAQNVGKLDGGGATGR